MKLAKVLLLSVSLSVVAATASEVHAARVYKWLDADGRIHYSDGPPPADVTAFDQKYFEGRLADPSIRKAISAAEKVNPVTLATSGNCGSACDMAREFLRDSGISFTEVDLRLNKAEGADNGANAGTGEVPSGAPTIKVGNASIRGFNQQKWTDALTRAGYPQVIVATARPAPPGRKGDAQQTPAGAVAAADSDAGDQDDTAPEALRVPMAKVNAIPELADVNRRVPDSFFGIHVRWGAGATPWPSVHLSSWRVIHSETVWYGVEPNRGDWKLGSIDRALAVAEKNDVDVLLTLGYSPTWAASRPREEATDGPAGSHSAPQNLADWETYVRKIATTYRGRIKYYEIWNEPKFSETDPPNSRGAFVGSIGEYVKLVASARKIIKSIDPDAKIVAPSVVGGYGTRRLDAFLAAGGKDVTDVVGYHFYAANPEEIPKIARAVREVMAKNGMEDRELWNTESGFLTEYPGSPIPPEQSAGSTLMNAENLGAYAARSLILGAAAGLERFYWYTWDVPRYALTRNRGKDATRSSRAYAETVGWLRGTTITGCSITGTVYVCGLTRGKRKAWAVWDVADTRDWTVPSDWNAVGYRTLRGRVSVIRGEHVRISGFPILLQADAEPWTEARPSN